MESSRSLSSHVTLSRPGKSSRNANERDEEFRVERAIRAGVWIERAAVVSAKLSLPTRLNISRVPAVTWLGDKIASRVESHILIDDARECYSFSSFFFSMYNAIQFYCIF